jgi:hypothetical protein
MDPQTHAAGVRRLVHEFNNLLFVIGGHCELLTEHCTASDQARSDLAAVAEAVSRAAALTAELKSMAIDVSRAGSGPGAPSADVVAG